MNIVKVLLTGSGVGASGSGYSFLALSDYLNKMGVETVLVVRKGYIQNILKERGQKHYVIETQNWTSALSYRPFMRYVRGLTKRLLNVIPHFQMLQIIRKEQPDIVHINALTNYIGAKEAIKCNKKLVWHIRELLEEDLGAVFEQPKKSLKLISKADNLISISRCVYEKYSRLLPNTKNDLIYNGVDIATYGDKTHCIFSDSKIVFSIAGRITKNKGQMEAIKGLSTLLKSENNVELQIAGTGQECVLSELYAYIRKEQIPIDKIKFLGHVEDMKAFWAQTDIAIVASKFEAFGRVTVEAMAAGCLVLGADTGGTDELIEEDVTGIKYHQGDSCSLAEKAEYILLHKDEMKKIAATGREYAMQHFTAEKNAQQVKEVYLKLLATDGKKAADSK